MIHLVKHANNLTHQLSLLNEDRIIVDRLNINTIIGVHDWEKKRKRPLFMSISLGVDIRRASLSDDLDDTVDYDQLSQRIKLFAESNYFQLIETLAEKSAKIILTEYKVKNVLIYLEKPDAISESQSVAIQIFRQNN